MLTLCNHIDRFSTLETITEFDEGRIMITWQEHCESVFVSQVHVRKSSGEERIWQKTESKLD